jgi:uncharacterized protein (TIGR02145 family)
MSKPILSIIIVLILKLEYSSYAQSPYTVKESETITDIDGNVYKTIQIGYQTWMAENLRTTKLRNGSPIQNIKDDNTWVESSTPAYCWYNNDINLKNTYGALYNAYVINEDICPAGWYVPGSDDWNELQTFLGNNTNIGGKLKEAGTRHWNAPNYKATNISGFTALPGGSRNPYDGTFYDFKSWGYWWENTFSIDSDLPQYRSLSTEDPGFYMGAMERNMGMSVRCIKEGSDSVPHLRRGLIAYFPFNGNTNDESGNGHHATSNGISFVPDRFGNQNSAISVSGENNSISFRGYQLPGAATTLTFWVMPTKDTNDTILQNTTPLGMKMLLRVVKKHYQLELKIGGQNIILGDSRGWTNCDPQRPRFDFIGISYNEESIRFIVNYRLLSEYSLPLEDLKLRYPVAVKQDPSFTFSGVLDDLRIYQRSVHENVMTSLNEDRQYTPPVVTADSMTLLGRDCARIHSTVNFSILAEPTETGVCWSTSPNPDTTHNKVQGCCGDVDIISHLEGLEPNTVYYVRAYATDSQGIGYSNELTLKTLPRINYGSVADIDGNIYKTVKIGTQTWMAENLKTTRYADGTPIKDGTLTGSVNGKYYYIYDNDPEYKQTYGLLYTWLAATNGKDGQTYPDGIQGVCPTGWHIPSKAEKDTLINFLGGTQIAGRMLKESGFKHWNYSPEGATNESGFSALGAGMRFNFENGQTSFELKKAGTFFWTSEAEKNGDYPNSPVIYLVEGYPTAEETTEPTIFGGSVRCIQNEIAVIPIKYGDVDSNALVQTADALITLKYSVGLNPLPKIDPLPWDDWRIKAADVDTVNGVTAFDASLIWLRALGIINSFPAESVKKNMISAVGDVTVAQEDGFIVFRSAGELYALNIVVNNIALQGELQIPDTTIISAVNISSGSLSVGLASAKVIPEGNIVMKIPVSDASGELVINTKINALSKQFKLNLATSVEDMTLTSVEVYPNPADDVLNFRNLSGAAVITVYDLHGKALLNTTITDNRIDISTLPKGIYFVHISNGNETAIRKVVK